MTHEIERQENRPIHPAERTRSRPVLTPVVDIYETNEQIVLTADMPGVDENNLDITLEQDVLTIEGHVKDDAQPGYNLAMSEYGLGDYHRAFTLATDVMREKISAEVKNGVLRLVLPKAEPAKAKKITVKAS